MPSVTVISALPAFVSVEAHRDLTASTPASFDSIPPVLRHRQENVSISFTPPLEGLQASRGTLYVLESVLVFMSEANEQGFEIKYPAITLHAISKAESGPYIYCQLDEGGVAAGKEDNEGDEEQPLRELTIVPDDADILDLIFEALSYCASLHPSDGQGDDDEDDGIFLDDDTSHFETFTGAEGQELSEVGRAALEHLESIIDDPRGLLKKNEVNGH